MAKLVCAYATSHILFSPKGVEDQANRAVAGMEELGRRAAAARPDLILMLVSEHMFNVNLAIQPPFLIGVADRWVGWGDMAVPPRPFPGHRDFAENLVRFTAKRGFDLAKAEEMVPDHAITLPLLFIKPWGSIPVVPLWVNINMEPVPSPSRCYDLAETIAEYIRERPENERVAVVGSGGLSHWLRIPNRGKNGPEFDQRIIAALASGKASEIARMTNEELIDGGGNGALEVLNWLMMAAIAGGGKGEQVYYEPLLWSTGMGGIAMQVQ